MKNKFNKYLLSFFLMFVCFSAFAEKAPPPPPIGAPPPPPGLPIDSGLSLLLLSGVFYGAYELKRKK